MQLKFHATFEHLGIFFPLYLVTFGEKDMDQQGHFHKNTARSHNKSKKCHLYSEQPSVTQFLHGSSNQSHLLKQVKSKTFL